MFNKLIANLLPFFPKKFVWLFSKSYIAGESIEDALKVSKELNKQGIMVTLDVLGEFIHNLDEAEDNKNQYLELIDVTEKNKIDGNYSVKPTMFGLLIDKEICYEMEDSQCVDMEIELFRRLQNEFPDNVGLVFQSYMKRTPDDMKKLMDIHTEKSPLNYRLCKGIYVESPEIAYKKYEVIKITF